MPFAPGNEVPANLSAVGLAREAVFNTALTPSQFSPFNTCGLMPETGLFYPQTMMGVRDTNVFPLYGQERLQGALDSPLFPLNGILAWIAAVGSDAYQSGSTTTTVTGTLANAAAGATSLSWTAVTGVPTAAMSFQISGSAIGTFGAAVVNAASATAPSFVVKPTSVTGAGPYTLNVPALPYAITASNNKGQSVVAPFFHGVVPNNRPVSLTVEKNMGGLQSEQYSGSLVNSFALKLPTTNAEASFSADFMSAGVSILTTPSPVTGIDAEVPFVFAEGSLSLFGQSLNTVSNVTFTLNNTVKDTFTVGTSHLPTFLTPTTRTLNGQLTAVFYSLNDPVYGYFQQAFPSTAVGGTPVQGGLNLTLTHPGTNGAFNVNMPLCNIKKLGDELRIGDVIMQTIDFEAAYSIPLGYSFQSYFSNNVQSTAY